MQADQLRVRKYPAEARIALQSCAFEPFEGQVASRGGEGFLSRREVDVPERTEARGSRERAVGPGRGEEVGAVVAVVERARQVSEPFGSCPRRR